MISLPSEIWEEILARLDFTSIVRSMRVCKDIYNTIEGSPLLNYIIELGVAGYIDNPKFIASPAHKIILLGERTRYWKQMSWKITASSKPSPDITLKSVRFSRGILIRGTAGPSVLPGEVLQNHYEILQLKQRETETENQIKTFGIAHSQSVLALDPGQDLLLLVSISDETLRLNFMHLGTMQVHPEARIPFIYLEKKMKIWVKEAQILESIIAISCYYVESMDTVVNFVFNWRTGETVLVRNKIVCSLIN